MEWQQLLGFYHAAQEKSFTKAAKLTFRTQSALSQQIKNLEEEFGCQLFERTSVRKINLTSEGERLFQFACETLHQFNTLRDDIEGLKGTPKGSLKVAAPFTTLMRLLPDIMAAYAKLFPYIKLSIFDRPQSNVILLIKEGNVDFGFTLDSIAPKELTCIKWKKVETVLMVPSGHPLLKFKRINIKQITEYPLILPPKESLGLSRSDIYKKLDNSNTDYHVIMESSNVELSSIYVEKGLGVSFATVIDNKPLLKERNLRFIPLSHLFKTEHLSIVLRGKANLPNYKQAFIELVFKS